MFAHRRLCAPPTKGACDVRGDVLAAYILRFNEVSNRILGDRASTTMRDERIVATLAKPALPGFLPTDSINHDLASRVVRRRRPPPPRRVPPRTRGIDTRVNASEALPRPLYMDATLVNGRDGAIRCSICINIYLASLRRALREMEARLPSSRRVCPCRGADTPDSPGRTCR